MPSNEARNKKLGTQWNSIIFTKKVFNFNACLWRL